MASRADLNTKIDGVAEEVRLTAIEVMTAFARLHSGTEPNFDAEITKLSDLQAKLVELSNQAKTEGI